MSGLNSIVGLNKVSVDYRPEIVSTVKTEEKKDVDNISKDVDNTVKDVDNIQNGVDNIHDGDEDVVSIDIQEKLPENGKARSVLQQLDVLLVNAATRSVTENAAKKAMDIGTTLQGLGVITLEESVNIEALAKTAADKLKALDRFTGAEIGFFN